MQGMCVMAGVEGKTQLNKLDSNNPCVLTSNAGSVRADCSSFLPLKTGTYHVPQYTV